MNTTKITIHRYELIGTPPMRVVGFLITSTITDKYQYIETLINFSDYENKTESEVCNIAYNKLKSTMDSIVQSFDSTPSIVGSEFVP